MVFLKGLCVGFNGGILCNRLVLTNNMQTPTSPCYCHSRDPNSEFSASHPSLRSSSGHNRDQQIHNFSGGGGGDRRWGQSEPKNCQSPVRTQAKSESSRRRKQEQTGIHPPSPARTRVHQSTKNPAGKRYWQMLQSRFVALWLLIYPSTQCLLSRKHFSGAGHTARNRIYPYD